MNADEVVLVVGACCWSGGVVDCAAGWGVDGGGWVGDFGVVSFQLCDGVGDVVRVKRAGIIGEFAASRGNGDA